jgi:hypothetical protein
VARELHLGKAAIEALDPPVGPAMHDTCR